MLGGRGEDRVIRGPGATLWGANAVDGVINVITKKAKSTQSAIVTAGAEPRSEPLAEFVMVANWETTPTTSLYKVFRLGPSAYPSGMTAHDAGMPCAVDFARIGHRRSEFVDSARRYLIGLDSMRL